jgi:hypothetical protein
MQLISLGRISKHNLLWRKGMHDWTPLGDVQDFSTRLTRIEGAMPALITKEGIPTDSPISAEKRAIMKEHLMNHINELQVKVRLLEEREKMGVKK